MYIPRSRKNFSSPSHFLRFYELHSCYFCSWTRLPFSLYSSLTSCLLLLLPQPTAIPPSPAVSTLTSSTTVSNPSGSDVPVYYIFLTSIPSACTVCKYSNGFANGSPLPFSPLYPSERGRRACRVSEGSGRSGPGHVGAVLHQSGRVW